MENSTQSVSYKAIKGMSTVATGVAMMVPVPITSYAAQQWQTAVVHNHMQINAHNQSVSIEMNSFTTSQWAAFNSTRHDLSGFYVEDSVGINSFLSGNPSICRHLTETRWAINRYFPGSPIRIKKLHDPEDPRHELLGVYIQVNIEPEQALEKLYAFWDNWMFDTLADVIKDVLIDVEYV